MCDNSNLAGSLHFTLCEMDPKKIIVYSTSVLKHVRLCDECLVIHRYNVNTKKECNWQRVVNSHHLVISKCSKTKNKLLAFGPDPLFWVLVSFTGADRQIFLPLGGARQVISSYFHSVCWVKPDYLNNLVCCCGCTGSLLADVWHRGEKIINKIIIIYLFFRCIFF